LIYIYLILFLLGFFEEFPSLDSIEAYQIQTLYTNLPSIKFSIYEIVLFTVFFISILKNETKSVIVIDRGLKRVFYLFLFIVTVDIIYGITNGNGIVNILFQIRALFDGLVLGFIFLKEIRTSEDINSLLKFLITIAFIKGCWGIYCFVNGIGRRFGDYHIIYYDFGTLLVILLSLAYLVLYIFEKKKFRLRWPAIIISLPMIFSFIYSFRRALLVGTILSIIFLLVIIFLKNKVYRLFKLALFLFLGFAASFIINGLKIEDILNNLLEGQKVELISDSGEESSNAFRVVELGMVLNNISRSPVIGLGWGSTYDITEDLNDISMDFFLNVNMFVHNSHLAVFLKMGILGGLVYLLLLYYYFKTLLNSYFNQRAVKNRRMLLIIIFMSGVYFMMFFFGPQIFQIRTMAIVVLTLLMVFPLSANTQVQDTITQ